MLMAETLCGNRVVIQLAKVRSCHSERSARNLSDVTIRSAILTEPLLVTSGLKFKWSSNRRNLNRRAISSLFTTASSIDEQHHRTGIKGVGSLCLLASDDGGISLSTQARVVSP